MTDSFKPVHWDDYIGQTKLKERLRVHIQGANTRNEALDHVLLIGPPGCGKTTLARLIAQEHRSELVEFIPTGNNVEMILAGLLMEYEGILFLDEVHRLSKKQQESLLPVIEEGFVQLPSGARIECPLVTVVAATTEPQKLIEPLYDRFSIKPPFDRYNDHEMGRIVEEMGMNIGISFLMNDARILGRATGGVPRNAKQFVKMARDLGTTDPDIILNSCRVTRDGLTELHIRYLFALMDCGGIAGVQLLAAHLQLPNSEVVNLERLLIDRNLVTYSQKGRQIMPGGMKVVKNKKEE